MRALVWPVLRAGGFLRPLLVAGCTAMVAALVFVAVALLRLPEQPEERLFSLVADIGTRYGTTLAIGLLALPPLLVLYQVVRIGTATRERRLAALRLAGATQGQVRLLGAAEVAVPAAVGALLGWPVYLLLRTWLGGAEERAFMPGQVFISADELRLVPVTVAPTWYDVLLVVLTLAAVGAAAGSLALRNVVVTPFAVTRRTGSRPPRPWGFVLLAGGALCALGVFFETALADPLALLMVAFAVLGMLGLASWSAHRAGRILAGRTRSAAALLAARRVVTDPRPAGRAAAAVGGIALVAGGAAGIAADLWDEPRGVERFYVLSLWLVAAGLVVALLTVVMSVAVHSAESLLDHRRSVASLAALGTPLSVVVDSQRWEARIAALPVAVLGVLLGALATLGLVQPSVTGFLVAGTVVVFTPLVVAVAVELAVLLVRPLAVRAVAPANLRTE